jgi:hypothetical protein
MLRKVLAVLLVASSVLLSGFDLLEEFDRTKQVSFNNFGEKSLPDLDSVTTLAESGDRTRIYHSALFGFMTFAVHFGGSKLNIRVAKIHKLHHVFLI